MNRLLVANRGEIALRIVRACRALGIETVAAYTREDQHLLHLRYADTDVCIGAHDYLSIPNLIMAARTTGCDSVHPGYGFLSENAEFAQAVTDAGLCFIGPAADHIALMGDKIRARADIDLPTLPGGPVLDVAAARLLASEVGYPVLLKAAAGGGGRGMRVVSTSAEIEGAFREATAEARVAFADDRMYVEKFLSDPRHIEVQVFGDGHGDAIVFGTRDCSTQRRHQKLIEEAPAPFVDAATLDALEQKCRVVVAGLGYRGAGTLEFLYDGDGFYFIEMNTRIQVEHTVTEAIYGIDLVALQLRVAAGEGLAGPPQPRGHAVECRLNAEDTDFNPSPGLITDCVLPGGPGVRVDSHVYPGYEVPHRYDSLLGKIICHGSTREEALARMRVALAEVDIRGIETNANFHRVVLDSERFRNGPLGTDLASRVRV